LFCEEILLIFKSQFFISIERRSLSRLISFLFPQNLTEHINERNRSAQIAQRESQLLFQTLYFKGKSPEDPRCIVEAVIFSIRANGFLVNTFHSQSVNVKLKFNFKNYLNLKLHVLYIFSVFDIDKIQKEKKYFCIIRKLFYLKLDTDSNKEAPLYLVERPSMLPNIKVLLFAIVNFCLFVFRSTFHVMASKDQFTYKIVRYQLILNLSKISFLVHHT
jgi:hypothetical protein